jgi:glycosyltransferase involved in cell wall biosynthesis
MRSTYLNLFYEEPDPDRWIKYDRYLRKIIRRLIRGKQRPGGVMMVAISLMKGLDKLGVPYRFNDYHYIRKHPDEIACIIGKPHLIFDRTWKNPIIFGAGVYSHPIECPDLFTKYPNVKRLLVPGEWMRLMCEPFYKDKVVAWPAGIDTDYWAPAPVADKVKFDLLMYDKIPGDELTDGIIAILKQQNITYQYIRYGSYTQPELKSKLANSKAAIFLSKSETQGLAYQQILSSGVPILAWDKGGYWEDPAYFPHTVKYQPVSSVPYWDERCGMKFNTIADFETKLPVFLNTTNRFKPRDYILENLTLEKSAAHYLEIYRQIEIELK